MRPIKYPAIAISDFTERIEQEIEVNYSGFEEDKKLRYCCNFSQFCQMRNARFLVAYGATKAEAIANFAATISGRTLYFENKKVKAPKLKA